MMMAELREKASDLKKTVAGYMGDEVTFSKLDFYLLGTVFVLAGVCIGFLMAPWTHGVSLAVGSHNGSNNGNGNADCDCDEGESSEEE